MSLSIVLPLVIVLTLVAGVGWGVALTLVQLRPEVQELQRHLQGERIVRDLQELGQTAIREAAGRSHPVGRHHRPVHGEPWRVR
jgi:hypothetical protein